MDLSPVHVSFVVACSALVAATIAPAVSLAVSRRQFNASVLSANREKWISRLRDTTAELASRLAMAAVQKGRWDSAWDGGRALLRADPAQLPEFQRIAQLYWELRLLTNPGDALHTALCREVEAAVTKLRQDDPAVRLEAADVERIATAAQAVLGAEWRRVKRGD
ncbi:MAG: hypothetical protein IT519_13335 [Burkholderiales bacterium]|jgi:hypothetical protein|nr:hypothetical protein [Burkholderiales bacterium]